MSLIWEGMLAIRTSITFSFFWMDSIDAFLQVRLRLFLLEFIFDIATIFYLLVNNECNNSQIYGLIFHSTFHSHKGGILLVNGLPNYHNGVLTWLMNVNINNATKVLRTKWASASLLDRNWSKLVKGCKETYFIVLDLDHFEPMISFQNWRACIIFYTIWWKVYIFTKPYYMFRTHECKLIQLQGSLSPQTLLSLFPTIAIIHVLEARWTISTKFHPSATFCW